MDRRPTDIEVLGEIVRGEMAAAGCAAGWVNIGWIDEANAAGLGERNDPENAWEGKDAMRWRPGDPTW